MAKNLIIVESPAKAKTIGKFLKGFKVEASMGHVRDLPKSQIGVDVDKNFEPKYITIRGKGDLISKLKKEAKNAEKIFLATDPDREGEAISWHLQHLLKIDKKEKCRVTFNEITKNAVNNAVKNPRQVDLSLVDAQQARRVLDRIVGYKISPLLWRKVRKGLSAGRVQSVATRLICDREEEIEKFVPEEYWTITANLLKAGTKDAFEANFFGINGKKVELKNKEQVEEIVKNVNKKEFLVEKIKRGEKKKAPPPPFITSTMQQEAARKIGYTTKKTMMVAQQLYEGIEVKDVGAIGLVTYIRTDSVRISSEAQIEAKEYIMKKFGANYVPDEFRMFKNKSAAQDAHEAIRPSRIDLTPDSIKESLTSDQYKLYKLVWERFLASQMAVAVISTLTVDFSVSDYNFRATGSNVKFDGYMRLYIEGKDDEGDEAESNIPDIVEGERVSSKKIEPKQHFTQPPPRYSEATLVKILEEKGIGRPSTYAPIISTILARGYVIKEKKLFFPTDLGKIVTDIMMKHFEDIVDVRFTAMMEDKLDNIEEGGKKWEDVIKEFYSKFINDFNEADSKIEHVELPQEVTDIPCEKCGKMMVVKHGRFGKFLACPGFPECRNARPILEEAGVNCPKCGGKVMVKKTKKSRKYFGCENNPKCNFMIWDNPSKESCPKCGNFLISKSSGKKIKVKCSNDECEYVREGEIKNND